MACVINPLNNSASELHQELLGYFNGNSKEADRVYNIMLSSKFSKLFGDWQNNDKLTKDRISPTGEPLLTDNKYRRKYITMLDGTPFFIDKKLLNYNYLQRRALVSTSIEYLFGGQVTSKEDIDTIDFTKLYVPGEVGAVNIAHSVFKGNVSEIQDLEELIKQYIGVSSLNITDKEDAVVANLDEIENVRNLDFRQSFEKNSKDNASANIKFLLSFVPKYNIDEAGNISATTANVGGQEMIVYNDFNEIWNYFEETLANIFPTANGKYTKDVFDEMVKTLQEKYTKTKVVNGKTVRDVGFNPTVAYALSKLILPLNTMKRNQFVHAFLKNKVNFYTTTIDRDGSDVKLTFFNSGDVTSRAKTVRKEIIDGLSTSSLFNNEENTFNKVAANQINDSYKKFVAHTRTTYNKNNITSDNLTGVVEDLNKYLRKLNININTPTILNFIDSFEGEPHANLVDAITDIGLMFNKLAISNTADFYKNKTFVNPLREERAIKKIAELESEFRKDISENTVLGPDNKKYWSYSLPSYLDIKLQKLKNNLENEIGETSFYKNSLWISKFKNDAEEFLEGMEIVTFLNLKNNSDGDGGVDNKGIQEIDQLTDLFNKAVLIKHGKYDYSIYPSPAPADKGRLLSFISKIFTETDLNFDQSGEATFSPELVDIYKGYFIDEYNRMRDAYDQVMAYDTATDLEKETLKLELYQNYHYDNRGELFRNVNGKRIPAGNAFKFGLFNEFNVDNNSSDAFRKLNREIINKDETPLFNLSDDGNYIYPLLSDNDLLNSPELSNRIKNKISELFNNTVEMLQDKGLVDGSKESASFIDQSLMGVYMGEADGDKAFATQRFIADSLFNQHISTIEYSKVFSGDYAYYKNLDDYSKRVPATYTDGIIPNLREGDKATYKMAILPDIIVNTDLYDGVDATDAQGWITLDRWKFLMERLNKWNPTYNAAFRRMKDGTATAADYKYSAQPLKGVYFDTIKGKPTYVKYSQAVLHPKMVKGTAMQKLYDNMIKNGIDEAVVLSGVKAGAITTSDIVDENNSLKDDMTFYPMELNNHSWKLQQDLSPKGIKDTLLGSQMQKNMIKDILTDADYKGMTGENRIAKISEIISNLSDMGVEALSKEIGLNVETGDITNRESFYEGLLKEVVRNGSDINTIEALKKEYPLDLIVTNRTKFQNLISSMVNNATVKLKTNGGSFIQMSAFGWDMTDAKKAGVKMLVNKSGLKPPRMSKDGKTVYPGQVFMTHQEIAKYLPDYEKLSMAELKLRIDPLLLTIVGYRIPNQDLASNDALEVIGILPVGMGDTIIPYIEITKKTGSDFDIDKMFLMLPHMRANDFGGNTVLEYVTGDDKKGLENELLQQYIDILTSPISFKNLTTPVDNDFLVDDINYLHGKGHVDSFQFFSPIHQIRKKFDNAAGKTGTAITANHNTDHAPAQIAKLEMSVDLGVGHVADGNTQFHHIFDMADNKTKVAELIKKEKVHLKDHAETLDALVKSIDPNKKIKDVVDNKTSLINSGAASTIAFVDNAELKGKQIDLSLIYPSSELDEGTFETAIKAQNRIKKKVKLYEKLKKCLK